MLDRRLMAVNRRLRRRNEELRKALGSAVDLLHEYAEMYQHPDNIDEVVAELEEVAERAE